MAFNRRYAPTFGICDVISEGLLYVTFVALYKKPNIYILYVTQDFFTAGGGLSNVKISCCCSVQSSKEKFS